MLCKHLSLVRFLALILGLTTAQLIIGCGGGGSSSGGGSGSSGGNNAPSTPAISSLSPAKVPAGSSATTLTVSGSGFVTTSTVSVGGVAEATTYSSATQLTATVAASQLTSGGNLAVVVSNGTVSSTPASLEVDNPAPTVSSLTPSTEFIGATSPVITLAGTGFVPTTIINVNGSARSTIYISATQVEVTLNSADVTTAGSLSLTAVNSTPGGGTSTAMSLPVNNPSIGFIQLNPSQLPAGATSPATITVTGNTFVPASVVNVNGAARTTTYVNPTTLTFVATVADQATQGTFTVTVTNPTPGGGTSPSATLAVAPPTTTPVITSVSPNSFLAGSPDSIISVYGTGFTQSSVVRWNGTPLVTTYAYFYTPYVFATVPAADLATAASANITVSTPTATPSVSNAIAVSITNPPAPTLTSLYPSGGPINTATQVTLNGTGFTAQTTVAVNGVTIPSTYNNSSSLTVTIPAATVALPGNYNITVTTPAPGGGTSGAQIYTTFVSMANNDIVYNTKDGLLYASVPAIGIGTGGNSVVGIDPVTGNVSRTIWVGSKPNKLALSSDGTQLFVGIDGAASVAQVDLTQGTVVNQFHLGGGAGIYNPPYTAIALAAVPGSPNSVAVAAGSTVAIYDSGVARPNASSAAGAGPLAFGSSASILYVANGSNIEQLTVNSTGITAADCPDHHNHWPDRVHAIRQRKAVSLQRPGPERHDRRAAGHFLQHVNIPGPGPCRLRLRARPRLHRNSQFCFNCPGARVRRVILQHHREHSSQRPRRTGLPNQLQQDRPLGTEWPCAQRQCQRIHLAESDLHLPITPGGRSQFFARRSLRNPDRAVNCSDRHGRLVGRQDHQQRSQPGHRCGRGHESRLHADHQQHHHKPGIVRFGQRIHLRSRHHRQRLQRHRHCQCHSDQRGHRRRIGVHLEHQRRSNHHEQSGHLEHDRQRKLLCNGAGPDRDLAQLRSGWIVRLHSHCYRRRIQSKVPPSTWARPRSLPPMSAPHNSPPPSPPPTSPTTAGRPSPSAVLPLEAESRRSSLSPSTGWSMCRPTRSSSIPTPACSMPPFPEPPLDLTGNSVVSVNPVTGTVGTPVAVGSNPTVMSETSDGNYLYIGLAGSDSLAQFDLQKQSLKTTIPITLTQTPVTATWLATMPGNDSTLAIDTNNTWGTFGIFDISGSTGTFRTNQSGIYNGVAPVWADQTHIYAFDSQTSGAEFYRYSVNSSGLTLIDGTTLNGMGGSYASLQVSNGLVYGAGGGIVNPTTTPPTQIATLPKSISLTKASAAIPSGPSPTHPCRKTS